MVDRETLEKLTRLIRGADIEIREVMVELDTAREMLRELWDCVEDQLRMLEEEESDER